VPLQPIQNSASSGTVLLQHWSTMRLHGRYVLRVAYFATVTFLVS
jgi:hypothetical protein